MNRNTYKLTALSLALAFVALPGAVLAQDANEIMALTRAQWAAEDANKPASEAWTSVADDYTEFNPVVPVLVQGKALSGRFYEANRQSGGSGVVSEMLNPHVQFYGDTAILSYNFAGVNKDKDGKMTPALAKSTRVYAKQGGKWMLVHANFAPVTVPD